LGQNRAERLHHNGRGFGFDHVFWSIAEKPKELNLLGLPLALHLEETVPMQ
jgi:hypothetical protein